MSAMRIFNDLGQGKRPVLIIDGEQLHSTATSREYLKEARANMKKWHRHVKCAIKPFYVDIQRVDPDTRVVTQWEKKEGFSLWYHPIGILD